MSSTNSATPADRLRHAVDHAAHLLPAQGPIQVFIHHNTLHAFEHLPFDEAVRRGAETFDTQPYLTEDRYLAALARGRIRVEHLRALVADDAMLAGLSTRGELRLALLTHPPRGGAGAELRFRMAEADALRAFAPETPAVVQTQLTADTRRWVMRDARTGPAWLTPLTAHVSGRDMERWETGHWRAFTLECLWAACRAGTAHLAPPAPAPAPRRHRDLMLAATGVDSDLAVHDLLIRTAAAFVDQGVAHWPLPGRAAGFFTAFLRSYAEAGGPPDRWLAPLPGEARRLLTAGTTPLDSLAESLELLGVPAAEWDAYLGASVLPLRGWGGMIRQMEERADRVAKPIRPDSFAEFLAVRLLLDRLSLAHVARRDLGYAGPLRGVRRALQDARPADAIPDADARAYPAFRLAQSLGWPPRKLAALSPDDWRAVFREIEAFDGLARRRLFQTAYEAQFREQTLDALCLHRRRPLTARPAFQAITCLDEREESFKRHLEEIAPACETFGAAGFFGVAMYYRGAADRHFTPLCPIIVTPKHWVAERVADARDAESKRKAKARKAVATASHRVHVGTRSFVAGAVLASAFGVLASVPLVGRILFPALAGRVRKTVGRAVRPPEDTRLELERTAADAGPEPSRVGYAVGEMAATAERFLRDIGLTRGFARLAFVLGHGSDSQNNPHKSAYDCGACGGSPGAPNGRALALMLNDPRVRAAMAANGVAVPADTHFVGGFHDTCDDSVRLFDLDRVPETHAAELAAARTAFDETCDRNAHERCRRFQSAPLGQTPAEARRHVRNRAEDLGQTRPELGHATNAVCIVGRREVSRGLFFDRRAFLTSYDPTQDDAAGSTLARLLGAAVPVCGGINLEYYFSHVDSAGYGCGTKLPHNVTGLLGVMDGAASDLRTGLPWQMVELHEPVRLLFVIETTPTIINGIMDRSPLVGQLIRNGWVQLALLDPATGRAAVFADGGFKDYEPRADHLPTAPTSADWYRGWRDHLEFAVIGAEGGAA